MEILNHLIKTGPTAVNLGRLKLDPTIFVLQIIDDQTETLQILAAAQKKATLAEFQILLQDYQSFAKLNR